MSRDSAKKRAKTADRWAANARPPARKPATYCTRCSAPLAATADIATHNQQVHLAGQR